MAIELRQVSDDSRIGYLGPASSSVQCSGSCLRFADCNLGITTPYTGASAVPVQTAAVCSMSTPATTAQLPWRDKDPIPSARRLISIIRTCTIPPRVVPSPRSESFLDNRSSSYLQQSPLATFTMVRYATNPTAID